jgi:hypothetical protein
MTYVIAEPCIGTKDLSCVEVCPSTAFIPRRTSQGLTTRRSSTSTPKSASTATRAWRRAPWTHVSRRTSCPRSGRSTSRSTPTITVADGRFASAGRMDCERAPGEASPCRGPVDRGQRPHRSVRRRGASRLRRALSQRVRGCDAVPRLRRIPGPCRCAPRVRARDADQVDPGKRFRALGGSCRLHPRCRTPQSSTMS